VGTKLARPAAFLNNLKAGQKFSDLPGDISELLQINLRRIVYRKKLKILFRNAGRKQKSDPGSEGN
jgi:hypothetical protein